MADLTDIRDRIQGEWALLLDSRREARVAWQDDVASQFEKRFLHPWDSEIPAFLNAIEALSEQVRNTRRGFS